MAVGGPALLRERDLTVPNRLTEPIDQWQERGAAVLHVVRNDQVIGALALEDQIRPESRTAVDALHALGVKVAMITGYLGLSRAMKRAKVDRRISERISLAIQQRLDCDVCLDAHMAAARSIGVDEAEIERAREGTSADPVAGIHLGEAASLPTHDPSGS